MQSWNKHMELHHVEALLSACKSLNVGEMEKTEKKTLGTVWLYFMKDKVLILPSMV